MNQFSRFQTLMFTVCCSLVLNLSADEARAQLPSGYFTDVRPVAGLEGPWRDSSPSVTSDGLSIYFQSDRPNLSPEIRTDLRDIWTATRGSTSEPFEELTKIETLSIDEVSDHSPYLFDNGLTVFFNSQRDGATTTYTSSRDAIDADWSEPVTVTMGLASLPDERSRGIRLSADGLTAVFDRPVDGSSELFISERASVDIDFEAVKLATELNRPRSEEYGQDFSADGRTLFFTRAESGYIRPKVYVAARDGSGGQFTAPMSIDAAFKGGDRINTTCCTGSSFVTSDWPADGSKLFFMRTNSFADFDIFEAAWVSTGLLGDIDYDGVLGSDDIELLTNAIRNRTPILSYDFSDNGTLDDADRVAWIEDLRNTYFGDSNLDGEFNSTDFVTVFQAGEFEDEFTGNSTWKTGDWNGDGEFDSGDFVLAFQEGGYEQGPRVVTVAVPEPSSALLLVSGVFAIARIRRSR